MTSLEFAQLLLRKAAQDEFVVRTLSPNPEAPDEAIGFHAQQAVEKALKAVLAFKGISYRWRHDIVELLDLLKENGVTVPAEIEEARRLNPFAVELRYGDMPDDTFERLDRAWSLRCVEQAREWAEAQVLTGSGPAEEGARVPKDS